MYIQVRLLKGFQEPLLYQVPEEWSNKPVVGSIVQVPIRTRIVPALIEKIFSEQPQTLFKIKQAKTVEPFPKDEHYVQFIEQLASYYQIDSFQLIKRLRQFLAQKEVRERATSESYQTRLHEVTLTPDQQRVVDGLLPAIDEQRYAPTVLHGVTSSGKTEIYKKLIEHTIKKKKSVLLLLPEVTLATQFNQLLKQQLSQETSIFGFHSATSIVEKRKLWKAVIAEQPVLIIGVHLPVLLPIAHLGLIIVDEEHEVGYQEKKHPKINSKEAAIWRAQINHLPILLGSATPSISSLYNVKAKGWQFFQLKKRFSGNFPHVSIVQLAQPFKQRRKSFWISTELEQAIRQRLEKKEQVIIFLNRRGYSFFVQCKQCSFVFSCANCSVSLTLHRNNRLTCHYCGVCKELPSRCPSCNGDEKNFLKKGIGTQQVVTILEKLFPQAHIARADLDTTVNKKKWQQTVADMVERKIDILVGTQTITKGYHFPQVTLVGVLWADLNLHFPIYNAAETTLQQLIQVAGRAGRQHQESEVIIQTMVDHPVFKYLNEVDYLQFYKHEIEKRQLVNYPPVVRLVELELRHQDELIVDQEAEQLVQFLHELIQKHNYAIRVLGPAKPPVFKVKNMHMQKIYLKGKNIKHIMHIFKETKSLPLRSTLFYTPQPTC